MRTGLASLLCVCALAATAIGCGEDSKRDDPGRAAEADPSASASAASQPAPEPGPSAAHLRQARRERRERAVEGAVRDFYSEVGYGDYDAAWARLTEPAQASLGGYDAWRAGYEFSISTRAWGVTAVDTSPRYALVLFELRSEDVDECADIVVQRFTGRWELAKIGRHWRATAIGAEKTGGVTPVTNFEDCPGYDEDLPKLGPPDYEYEPPDEYSYPEDSYPDPGDDYDYDPDYDYDYDYGAPTTEDFGNGQGSVGLCEDGTLSDSIGRQGACSHHGGVAD